MFWKSTYDTGNTLYFRSSNPSRRFVSEKQSILRVILAEQIKSPPVPHLISEAQLTPVLSGVVGSGETAENEREKTVPPTAAVRPQASHRTLIPSFFPHEDRRQRPNLIHGFCSINSINFHPPILSITIVNNYLSTRSFIPRSSILVARFLRPHRQYIP
jgi:hypothetical protein